MYTGLLWLVGATSVELVVNMAPLRAIVVPSPHLVAERAKACASSIAALSDGINTLSI